MKLDFVIPVVGSIDYSMILNRLGYAIIPNLNNQDLLQGERSNGIVYIDNGRRFLGINGLDIHEAHNSLTEIISTINKVLSVDLKNFLSFYETEISGFYYFDNNVFEIFTKLYNDSQDVQNFSNIIGTKVSQSSIKLTSFGKNVNSAEWYEMYIEPKINSPGNAFFARMICRNSDLSKVIEIGKNMPEVTKKIIDNIIQKN